jgi:hypothetical protein
MQNASTMAEKGIRELRDIRFLRGEMTKPTTDAETNCIQYGHNLAVCPASGQRAEPARGIPLLAD